MNPAKSEKPTGRISALLGGIAELLRTDERSAAFRAREFLKRYPGQQSALMLLVSARRLAGDLEGARNMLRALAKAEPSLAAIQYELGQLLLETGDCEGAITAFSRVTQLEPTHEQAWRALGDALCRCRRLDEAKAVYAKHFAISRNPARSNPLSVIGGAR
jgi:Flp pilus assembly protein TadD